MKKLLSIALILFIYSNVYSQTFTISEMEKIVLANYNKADIMIQERGFVFNKTNNTNGIYSYFYNSKFSSYISCSYFDSINKSGFIYLFNSQDTYLRINKSLDDLKYEYVGVENDNNQTYSLYYKEYDNDYYFILKVFNKIDGVYIVNLTKKRRYGSN